MSRGTGHISVRVPPEVRAAAKATARDRGETLSDVCRLALTAYHHNPAELLKTLKALGGSPETPHSPSLGS